MAFGRTGSFHSGSLCVDRAVTLGGDLSSGRGRV